MSTGERAPMKVAVTGAAGAIGYQLLFRIASGQLLGPNQPVILQCVELPHALNALKGVAMELDDCAFPLLRGIVQTDSIEKGFEDADAVLLVGSKPRGKGQERGDLLKENGKIFTAQGKALNKFAKRNVKVIVVGNPANTNCLIASANAPDIPRENFSAMTRLDHNRAVSQVVQRSGARVSEVDGVIIWGNHSSTQYPDLHHATVKGAPALNLVKDFKDKFIPDVQQRGAAIIAARGASSAGSAANAAIDHMRDWFLGHTGKWTSMAVASNGKDYGVPEGVFFSYPVTCGGGNWKIVRDLKIDEYSEKMIRATQKELFEERDAVKEML